MFLVRSNRLLLLQRIFIPSTSILEVHRAQDSENCSGGIFYKIQKVRLVREMKMAERTEAVFRIGAVHAPKKGMTISKRVWAGKAGSAVVFSLGEHTDISAERHDCAALYIGVDGESVFTVGEEQIRRNRLREGDMLFLPGGTLAGQYTEEGKSAVHVEILFKEEMKMNDLVKAAEVFQLGALVPYEEGSIANLDLASNSGVKFMVLSFDEGTALEEHRAPGDALIFALEGKAVIGYEGKQYLIAAGENFRFEKNGLHSVKADGRFKMALLLMRE